MKQDFEPRKSVRNDEKIRIRERKCRRKRRERERLKGNLY